MRKNIIFYLTFWLLLSASGLSAQVKFENGLTLAQVREKAKLTHKYIFIDCYATWCGPCKMMDRQVYPNDTVAAFFNKNFISVKVQTDTSKNDDPQVKAWYADARDVTNTYTITELPTFLFFSPDAKLLHREAGYLDVKHFLALAADALNPEKAFYARVENYRKGVKDYPGMAALAADAGRFHQPALADSIATDYIYGYLFYLPKDQLLSASSLKMIANHPQVLHRGQKAFNLFFNQPAKIDSILRDAGVSRRTVNYVITGDAITPELDKARKRGTEPDWERIGARISSTYGKDYVPENILNAKVGWYEGTKNWPLFIKYLIQLIEKTKEQRLRQGLFSAFSVNQAAWEVFDHSAKTPELKRALNWSVQVSALMKTAGGPNYAECLDTQANLLYKLGKKKQALTMEETALSLSPQAGDISANLAKMKAGLPTWKLPE